MPYEYRKNHKLIPVDSWLINSYVSASKNNDYPVAKWIQFCKILLDDGFTVSYYKEKKTVSKYVHVVKGDSQPYVVRFSNHKPLKRLEEKETCHFFVGITNFKVTRTEDALKAVYKYFRQKPKAKTYYDFMKGKEIS